MGTVTIRPDSSRDSVGITSGGLSSVNDASDSTFLLFSGGGKTTLGFANPTIPAGAQIRGVQLFYRTATTTGGAFVTSRLYVNYPSGAYKTIGFGFVTNTTIFTFNAPNFTSNPTGKTWSVADVNNISATIFVNPNVRLYDVWITITYNETPVVAVTAPTGTFTTSVRPEIDWSWTDPDGDAQERYRLKIFTSAQYSAVGFNPETSVPTWDSGTVYDDAQAVRLPVNLANATTYRAYVKASDAGSQGRYSAWAFTTFTISVPIPATPTLTVAATAATNVTLTVGGLTSGNGAVVERSDDAGLTWAPVRGSWGWLASSGSFVGTDYEPPVNLQTRYRAWQWNTDSFSNVFASGYSTVVTVLVSNNILRLKDPLNPGAQATISLRDNLQVTSPRAEGIFDPIGSAVAVVLVDASPGGDRIELPLQFKTDTAYRAFMALRASGHVLQLLTDTADRWYVQLTGSPQTTTQASSVRLTSPYRTLDLTAVQVASPPDLTPAPGS